MKKLTGSCNCGAVRYEVDGESKNVVNCHCGLCRKMNGAAFSTYVVVLESDFRLLGGELRSWEVSENSTKFFCAKCGTPIFNANPKFEGLRILHLGSLDDSLNVAPQVNIYCESQVGWLDGIKELLSLDQGIA
jgi:hypothetical protein